MSLHDTMVTNITKRTNFPAFLKLVNYEKRAFVLSLNGNFHNCQKYIHALTNDVLTP